MIEFGGETKRRERVEKRRQRLLKSGRDYLRDGPGFREGVAIASPELIEKHLRAIEAAPFFDGCCTPKSISNALGINTPGIYRACRRLFPYHRGRYLFQKCSLKRGLGWGELRELLKVLC